MGSIEHLRKDNELSLPQLDADITAVRPNSALPSIALPDYVVRAGTEWPWDDSQVFCPNCAAETRRFIDVLDSRQDKRYRVFACECGEVIWLDKYV
jgi:hypothetical protein